MLFRSRIEGLTKFYGVSIAIGSALRDHLGNFAVLELDRVRVIGRAAPERVFVLLGDEAFAKDAEFTALRERHEAMLVAYRAGDWGEAGRQLPDLNAQAASFGLTPLYALYADRIETLSSSPPPAGWDGVYEARSK